MSKQKQHHYIPRMLSQWFVDNKGKLYFFNKDFPKKGILRSTPDKLFRERYLYTMSDEGGDRNDKIEKMLGRLEAKAAPIIEKIIDQARASKFPELTYLEKETLDQFLCCMMIRVPDVFDPIANNTFEEFPEILEKHGPLTAEDRRKRDDPNEQAKLKQDLRASSVLPCFRPEGRILPILGDKSLLVVVIPNPKKSFVIGSNPCVKFFGGNELSDPKAEAWFPLAYDVAVVYSGSFPEKLYKILDPTPIREINEAIYKQSSFIAGRSDKLIASLTGVKQRP